MKTQKSSNNNNITKIKYNTSWNELFHVQALTDTEPHKFLKLYHTNAACCELCVVSREPHCCCYCKYYASYLLVVFCFVHHGTSAVRWGHVGAAVLLILLLKLLISNKISNAFLFFLKKQISGKIQFCLSQHNVIDFISEFVYQCDHHFGKYVQCANIGIG